jgi:hypothetical protein
LSPLYKNETDNDKKKALVMQLANPTNFVLTRIWIEVQEDACSKNITMYILSSKEQVDTYIIHIKNRFSINLLWQNLYCSHGLECVNLD